MRWKKLITRGYFLLDGYYSQLAYQRVPGFSIKNVLLVNKNGVCNRYLDESEFERFNDFIRKNKNLKQIFKKGLKIDKELREIVTKKDAIKNFPAFHKKYLEYWAYLIIGYYLGLVLNKEQIKNFKKEVEFIRGDKSVKNYVEAKFFPRLLKQLENKTKIPSSLLEQSFPEEIMNNKFDISVLKQRKKYYVWLIKNKKSYFYLGNKAKEIEKRELKKVEKYHTKMNEIKGTPASGGYVKGKVKILMNYKEVNKVKKGDILVTSMTNPKYTVAMNKAAAFVTDEGGITCHAAITSREMKKPCIIGTKTATKVFKDEDLVEVDAEKGVIRKIK